MTDKSYQKVMSEIESMTAEDIEKLSKEVTKMKPCPFCGEMPEWHQDLYDNTYCLYCNNEKCDTDMVATDHYENKEDAIKAWNKRTSPWQTGTPTEEGWYLCQLYNDGNWYNHELYKADYFSIIDGKPCWSNYADWDEYPLIAWQKIIPYEEKEKDWEK